MANEIIAEGKVLALCVNGRPVEKIHFLLNGPHGDRHSGFIRKISGHDTVYLKTSALKKGDLILNERTWTGLSREEIKKVEDELGYEIPQGCLLENIIFSGIPNFSKLPSRSRIVFPGRRETYKYSPQAVLTVTEENSPCDTVGLRLADHHKRPELKASLVKSAINHRGVMGTVYSAGYVYIGDEVKVYPPVT